MGEYALTHVAKLHLRTSASGNSFRFKFLPLNHVETYIYQGAKNVNV